MRYFIKYVAIYFLTFLPILVIGQDSNDYTPDIRVFKKEIDSLRILPDSVLKKVGLKMISKEYSSTKKGKKLSFHLRGLLTQSRDTLYYIFFDDDSDHEMYKTFYYRDNKLIYAKGELWHREWGKAIYTKEEYYKNGIVVYRKIIEDDFNAKNSSIINFSLFADGINYIKMMKN